MTRKMLAAAAVLATFAAVLVSVEPAWAQCAMCRTALDQEGGQVAAGFNRGILFLLAMPYVVFGSIAGSWYWKRRKSGGALGTEKPAE
jgi:hypothetical protein